MLAKLAALAALGATLWFLFLRSRPERAPTRGAAPQRRKAEDLTPCATCGQYRAKDALCECDRAPTP